MRNKLIAALKWCLRKLGYSIPVIKPTLIEVKDCKRKIAQERLSYYQIREWTTCSAIDLNKEIERRVREEMAWQIANELKVFKIHTPDGIDWRCDVIYRDMEEFEKNLDILSKNSYI